MIKKGDWKILSKALISASLVAIVLAGVGYLGTDIWLASTQWLLAASVLAALGVYARVNT